MIKRIVMLGSSVVLIAALLALYGLGASTAGPEADPEKSPRPVITEAVKHDVTEPLREMIPSPPNKGALKEIPLLERDADDTEPAPGFDSKDKDGALQADSAARKSLAPPMPGTVRNFDGVNNINNVLPPDTNGDVGRSHYVQMVNLAFAIYDKAGNLVYGPVNNNTLWDGFGGACEALNNGDPIVLYDPIADRWIMSQFAIDGTYSDNHECIAISKTGDPTGSWYRYDFLISKTKMNDYPKLGVWPDGYYMSYNEFSPSFSGVGVTAFERDKMLQGLPARMVNFDLESVNPNFFGMLPSDLDGATLPPAGSPNYFVEAADNSDGWPNDALHIFKFKVDWTNPEASTFTGPTVLNTAAFDSNLCNYLRNCIPQLGTAVKVAAISDRLMFRLAYRNIGGSERLVVNHTVDSSGSDDAGIRWYEIRNPGGAPTIHQQSTYAPADGKHRWMGSIAMDKQGNMALGYSISSATMYPGISYVGRLATDPLSTMPLSEGNIIAGGGSQTNAASRWGDYSSMSVDPVDDCTFWYTTEYLATTGSAPWRTRIASFKFPGCTSSVGKIKGRVTSGGPALPGAVVAADNGTSVFTAYANVTGDYEMTVPVGSYNLRTFTPAYPQATSSAAVTSGGTVTKNIAVGSRLVDVFHSESFDTTSLPAGWLISDDAGTGKVWRFDDPGTHGNLTGGSGGFAVVDSDFAGASNMNTSLVSPGIDLTSASTACLTFDTDFFVFSSENADVDVSTDDAATWTSVWQKTASARGPRNEYIDVSSKLAGQPNARVRFHYYDANFEWWWQVDDFAIEECDKAAPVNPSISSSTHVVNNWADGTQIKFFLSGATDAISGVGGYSFNFSKGAAVNPDTEMDANAWETRLTSPPLSDGTWYLNLRTVDNNGNWSAKKSVMFKVDNTVPESIYLQGPAAGSWNSASPTFSWAPSVDLLSGLSKYQLLIDGAVSRPLSGSSIAPTVYTATPGAPLSAGTHSAKIRGIDAAGNIRDSAARSIKVDAAAPTGAKMTNPVSAFAWSLPATRPVAWTAADAQSGIGSYTVRTRRAPYNGSFGAYSNWQSATTSTSTLFTQLAGNTYCFGVSAKDKVGNASAFSGDQCIAHPLNNTSFSHSSGWTKKTGSGYYRNSYSRSKTLGAKLTRTGVKTKRIALIATKCSGCGKVKVYLGTTLLSTVNLSASTTKKKQVIAVKTFSSVKSGTVTVKVSTSGKPVLIEGLGLSRN